MSGLRVVAACVAVVALAGVATARPKITNLDPSCAAPGTMV